MDNRYTYSTATIIDMQTNQATIKITFTLTGDTRLIGLTSISYSELASKARSAFKIDDPTAISVQYIDDEGDRVALSYDDELSCALMASPPGEPLQLFISAIKNELIKSEDNEKSNAITPIPTESAQAHLQQSPQTQDDQVELLLVKLEELGLGSEKRKRRRNAKLIRKFDGDLNKVISVIERRRDRSGRRPENKSETYDTVDAEPLIKQLEEMGFRGTEGMNRRLARLLRKFNYDVAGVEAFLNQRKARCHEARMQRKGPKQVIDEDTMTSLLRQLDAKGFGGDERKTRRNARLVRRFGGDLHQVEAVLTTRKAKMINDIPPEYEQLLAQLDTKGLGGDDFERKRNVRLIKRFNGDLARLEGLIARRQAAKQALAKYEPLLSQLEEKGMGSTDPVAKRRNLRLLKRFDGDIAQVEACLDKRQQRQRARKIPREQRACRKATL